MAAETFDPPVCPSFNRGKTVSTRTLSAAFGDGYTQRAADGLNSVGRTLALSWRSLSPDEAQAIEDFFLARGGTEAFLYAGRDGVTRKWIVREWQRNELGEGNRDSISATFEQVFDLG